MKKAWAKKAGCNCKGCPLEGCPGAWIEPAEFKPRLAIFAEEPGKTELRLSRPLVGESGRLVNETLDLFGIDRRAVHVSNSRLCKADQDVVLEPGALKDAALRCQPRVINEVKGLPKGTLVMLLGAHALYTFTGFDKIKLWRGYPMLPEYCKPKWAEAHPEMMEILRDYVVFPTYHPSFILHKPAFFPAWRIDWDRALGLASGKVPFFKWPPRIIHEGPEMVQHLEHFLEQGRPVGVDIEGSGKDPFDTFIRCIGISDGEVAVSVPWPPEDNYIEGLVRRILKDPSIKLTMQNGNFDMIAFEALGFEVNGYDFDTLVAHHEVGRQLDHDLGTIASLEFAAPRWKALFDVVDDRKGSEKWEKVDPEELRKYNCGDALFTAALRKPLQQRIKESHLGTKRFAQSMEILHINRQMAQVGIAVDPERRAQHGKNLGEKLKEACEEFDKYAPGVNPNSHKQLRDLLFGKLGCKPRERTDSGEWSTDGSTLEDIIADEEESQEAKDAVRSLLTVRAWSKLKSTYVDGLPVSKDGKVHPNWKKTTISDRHNSSEPNMQNVPDGSKTKLNMRDMFIAEPGKYFVAADYGQLEARIQALRAGEEKLIDQFNNDFDFDYHSFFTALCWGIPYEEFDPDNNPQHYKLRKVQKNVNFGLNYGGGAPTIHKAVVIHVPKFTLKMVEDLIEKVNAKFPKIAAMRNSDLDMARECGFIDLPFGAGRFYYYLGRVRPTQVANLPMQAGAAAIINRVMCNVAKRLDWEAGEAIVAQIHDELLLQGPNPKRLQKILIEEMPQRLSIGKHYMEFPIGLDVGTRWSDMEEVGVYYAK